VRRQSDRRSQPIWAVHNQAQAFEFAAAECGRGQGDVTGRLLGKNFIGRTAAPAASSGPYMRTSAGRLRVSVLPAMSVPWKRLRRTARVDAERVEHGATDSLLTAGDFSWGQVHAWVGSPHQPHGHGFILATSMKLAGRGRLPPPTNPACEMV
jgi:hypothetical protein